MKLGALKERTGETEVKASDDGYTVTVPVSFEKADANFVYIFRCFYRSTYIPYC